MRLRITDLGYIRVKSGLECTFLDPLWSTLYPAFFLHREHVYFRVIWTILRVFFSLPVVFDLYLSTGVRAGILFSSDSQRGKSMTQNRFNITVGDIDDVLIRRVRKVRKCTVVHPMEMYTQDTQVWLPTALATPLSPWTDTLVHLDKCFNGPLLSVRHWARSGDQTHDWDMVSAIEVLGILTVSFNLLLNTNWIIL